MKMDVKKEKLINSDIFGDGMKMNIKRKQLSTMRNATLNFEPFKWRKWIFSSRMEGFFD